MHVSLTTVQFERPCVSLTPIWCGRINDVEVNVTRDSGSTSCVVRTDVVREAQKTGSSYLCMLIDGTIKRFPMANVDLDTPYLSGKVQALCMDDPVHDVIIGNVPGAKRSAVELYT